MKKALYTILFAAVLLASCSGASNRKAARNANNSDNAEAIIAFREYEHHFGTVREGEKVTHTFTFENQGDGNLVILSALAACGCTVPQYDKRPIAPGKRGKIDVRFDTSGRDGMQTKTVTINSNAATPVVILKITADVVKRN